MCLWVPEGFLTRIRKSNPQFDGFGPNGTSGVKSGDGADGLL